MWAIIKIDIKKISTLKKDFFDKLGGDVEFYMPKLRLKKYIKSKIYLKEVNLLGNYLLCFHKDLANKSVLNTLKNSKGLKYILNNFSSSQIEIQSFINKCKENEDKEGYIKQNFFNFKSYSKYKFISGPFTNLIFTIINENNFTIKALMGNYKISVSKEQNLFRPV